MSQYTTVDGYKFDAQVNYGWGLTLNMTGKAPEVSKRIFDTYEHMLYYVNDYNDSCIQGLTLAVMADGDNNGLYFVDKIGTKGEDKAFANDGKVTKLATGSGSAAELEAAIKALKGELVEGDAETLKEINDELDEIQTEIGAAKSEGAVASGLYKVIEDAVAAEKTRAEAAEQANTNAIANEKTARENAISDIIGSLEPSDAATLEAINDELNSIQTEIGEVAEGKTVVDMIAEAKAAATTTIVEGTDGGNNLEIIQSTNVNNANVYTINLTDVASAQGLADEITARKAINGQTGDTYVANGGTKYISGATSLNDADVKLDAGIKENAIAIANEITRATAAEQANATDIANEVARATAAENTIEASIGLSEDGLYVPTTGGNYTSSATSVVGAISALDTQVKTNADAIATLNGNANTAGSVAKAVADAKAALLGDAAEDYNTLGKLEDKVIAAEAAAKAAATKIEKDANAAHLTLSESTNETTGAITYTIGENNIASAQDLADEITRAEGVESGLDERLEVIEGEGEGSIKKAVADEASARTAADDALVERLGVIEGEGEGSIKKAVADAKAAIEGTLGEGDAATLEALNDRIDTAVADAKTYSIAEITGDELTALGTNVKEAWKLVDEDSKQSGKVIKIYKDSSLKSVALDGQTLKFTYILANGSESVVGVDVSSFLAESEFKNGLQVVDHIVSVKIDASSEEFLTVGENGVKLSGVKDAINSAVNNLDATVGSQTIAEGKHVAVEVVQTDGKLTGLTIVEDDIASAKALDAEISRAKDAEKANADAIATLNGEGEGSVAKAVADAVAAEKTRAEGVETSLQNAINAINNAESGILASAKTYTDEEIDKVESALTDEIAARKAVDGQSGDTYAANSDANYISNATSLNDADIKLDAAIKAIDDSYVKAVTVNGVDARISANKATVTIDAADIKLDEDYSASIYTDISEAKLSAIGAEDTIDSAIKKLEENIIKLTSEVIDNEQVCAASITAIQQSLGLDENLGYVTVTGASYINASATISDALIALDSAISGVSSSISADLSEEIAAIKTTIGTVESGKTVVGMIAEEATARENADNAINNKIGTVAEGKTVVGMIAEAKAAATTTISLVDEDSKTDGVQSMITLESQTEEDGSLNYLIGFSDTWDCGTFGYEETTTDEPTIE